MVFRMIIAIILFANVAQAKEDENLKAHGNNQIQEETSDQRGVQTNNEDLFREQLMSDLKAQYSLSFFSDPMLSIYASSCDEETASSAKHSLEQICNIVVNSKECKDVEPKEDLLDCSRPEESKNFDTLDFIIGCSQGLWNTVVEFFNFLWTIIRNAVDIPEKFMEYVESAKLYLVNEYDKAYEEASSFKTLKAIKAVAFKLGEKVYNAMQEMAQKEYKEFGCLNFEARTKKVCTLLGAFVDPFILLKTLKLGKLMYRMVSRPFHSSEKASNKVLKKARKRLGISKKDVKEQARRNKELLSQYQESGDIQKGVIQVKYVGRKGELMRGWVTDVDNKYIFTEGRREVPRNQITSVQYDKKAAKGVAEHQRLLNILDDSSISHDFRDIEIFSEQIGRQNLRKAYSDGVLVDSGIRGIMGTFVRRRQIEAVSHAKTSKRSFTHTSME